MEAERRRAQNSAYLLVEIHRGVHHNLQNLSGIMTRQRGQLRRVIARELMELQPTETRNPLQTYVLKGII